MSTLQATVRRSNIQPIFNEGLTNARSAATLQATVRRSNIQPIFNEGLTNARSAIKIQSAIRNRTAKRDMMKQTISRRRATETNGSSKRQSYQR